MKKKLQRDSDCVDIRDIDWQAECHKWNYLVGNDEEWYRYAVHNIVDETEPLYHTEEQAWEGLYEYLQAIWEEVNLLPTFDELRWE